MSEILIIFTIQSKLNIMFVENEDPIVSLGIGHKITKGETRNFVKKQLSTNKTWATQALLKIYEFQTSMEKEHEETRDANGVGFSGVDGEILSSFATHYISRGFLSPKQMALVFKKMPKYWMQVIKISDKDKLEKMVRKSLAA